jgi:hypothetical protein
MKTRPTNDAIELSASIEVAKTIAFYALNMIIHNIAEEKSGDVLHGMKNNLITVFNKAEISCSKEDAEKYRSYAEGVIEELFARVSIDGQNMRGPLS